MQALPRADFELAGFDLAVFIRTTLAEDLGEGLPGGGRDVTCESVIPAEARFAGVMDSRDAITVAGLPLAAAFIALDANVLEGYTGHYKLSDTAVMTVTRTGTQLWAKLTGQQACEIFPDSPTHFIYKVVKADVDFVISGTTVTAVTLNQNGRSITMPRIDAGTAQLLESTLSARVQRNLPSPGTETALRNFIQRREAGLPVQFETMSPALATAMREQMSQADQIRATLGKLQSIQFQGVGTQGYDTYTVKYENASMIYRIQLDQSGIITGMSMSAL